MKKITFKELKRWCFCNSKKLIGTVFLINNKTYEWIGIGMTECDSNPEWMKRKIEVVE